MEDPQQGQKKTYPKGGSGWLQHAIRDIAHRIPKPRTVDALAFWNNGAQLKVAQLNLAHGNSSIRCSVIVNEYVVRLDIFRVAEY